MKKRALSLILTAAVVSASLAGCTGGGTSASAASVGGVESGAAGEAAGTQGASKDSLVIVTSSDILSMDPYRYDEGPTNQFMLHIYEPLVMADQDMKYQPCLAESWEQSEDGLTWTFHLRQGVKFHDGNEMTAEDVLASIDVAANPDSPSAFTSYTSTFESWTAPDDYTVVIKTKRLNPLMLFNMAQIYILEKENVAG